MAARSIVLPADVKDYLNALPERQRRVLLHLRAVIRSAAPKAEERLSYGMPAFRYGTNLVYYAAYKDHYSFFVGSVEVRRRFASELRSFQGGKETLRFTAEHPIPDGLLRRMVRARVAENEARARRATPSRSRARARRAVTARNPRGH